jgi:hypothetical protein
VITSETLAMYWATSATDSMSTDGKRAGIARRAVANTR